MRWALGVQPGNPRFGSSKVPESTGEAVPAHLVPILLQKKADRLPCPELQRRSHSSPCGPLAPSRRMDTAAAATRL
jgi:hypothetical protein